MSQLSDYRILCFDVYGTLVDWEGGILAALLPTIEACNTRFSREEVLNMYYELEREQQRKTPDLAYSKLLATVYPTLILRLGLVAPSPDEHIKFSESITHLPAFSDKVEGLKYLRKYYKLVVLSNVDRVSSLISSSQQRTSAPISLICATLNTCWTL